MRFPRMTSALLAGLALAAAFPQPAHASPWTLRQGDVVVGSGFDYQFATSEFLNDQTDERAFPLNGRYGAAGISINVRGGFTDRFELELSLPFRLVSYESDPVLLAMRPAGSTVSELDFYQENVLDFTQARAGVADLGIAGRYQIWASPIATAVEVRLKEAPTGYPGPSGTFGREPATADELAASPDLYVRPANVRDDVTLGDGQLDIQANLLLGYAFRTRTFIRIDAGYNLRLAGAGDEFRASFKAGQLIADVVLLFGEARLTLAVEQGDRIGVSVGAIDPSLPAEQYGGTTNLLLREVRLERDAIDLALGGLVRITPAVEAYAGYARTVWGRNTAATNTFFLGFAVRTNVLPPPPETEDE
jgi:hypothetical protein